MASLGENLDGIRVRVRTPGGEIEAELRQRTSITISFGESVYDFVSETALERLLAGLARLLWTGWQRQYRAVIDETDLRIGVDDLRDANFFADRAKVEAVGESDDGRVSVTGVGMESFAVHVKPGTVREIPEDRFAVDVSESAKRLIWDFQMKVNELKKRYYE